MASVRKIGTLFLLLALPLAPKVAVPQEGGRIITVATYNVHGIWVPPPFLPRVRRFPEIAESLDRFDVVFLEELFISQASGDRFRRHLLEPARQAAQCLPQNDQGPIYSSGLAILSIPPSFGSIPGCTFAPYSGCKGQGPFHGSDCEAKKGVLFNAIDLEGKALHLYATHLDAGSSAGDRDVRVRQIGELQEIIRKQSNEDPLILAGDFNVEIDGDKPDAIALRAFRDALGLRDLCASVDCNRVACTTWKLCSSKRIDYIFFRSGQHLELTARSAGWTENRRKAGRGSKLSDHPLLWGELETRSRAAER